MLRNLLIILLMTAVLSAAPVVIKVTSPGLTGMATNVDVDAMRDTDSRYSLNVDVSTDGGLLQKRLGLQRYGTASARLLDAFYLYDAPTKLKTYIGIQPRDSMQYGPYVSSADTSTVASTFWSISDTIIAYPVFTKPFRTTPDSTIINWPLNVTAPSQKFVATESFVYYVDGYSPPATFTAVDAFTKVIVNGYVAVDSIDWGPNVTPLSLEPPGALRAFAINKPVLSYMSGTYQYAVSFKVDRTNGSGSTSDTVSVMGPPSMEITVDSGVIALTAFPVWAVPIADSGDTIRARIYRKNLIKPGSPWLILDSIEYQGDDIVWYIDSIAVDPTGVYSDTINVGDSRDSVPIPGAPFVYEDYGEAYDTNKTWVHNTDYYFKCSWFDPVTGAESPLGPSCKYTSADTSALGDNAPGILTLPYYYGWGEHAKHMRVYMTLNHNAVIGNGDTLIWYLFAQVDMDSLNNAYNSTSLDINQIIVGNVHDTVVANGIYTLPLFSTDTMYYYEQSGLPNEWELGGEGGRRLILSNAPVAGKKVSHWLDADGGPIVRPPYISNIAAPFTTMEYANGRMWGAGDTRSPSRLFYSEYDELHDWPGFNFLDLSPGDGDAITAIERIPVNGVDALVVFKRNKTFLISGYDPEFDAQVFTLSEKFGAFSQSTVIERDGIVYFVSRDLDIYRIVNGGVPEEISRRVKREVWHVFRTISATAGGKAPPGGHSAGVSFEDIDVRAMAFEDAIMFVNQAGADRRAMAWDTKSETWSVRKYRSPDAPRGTFRYDTTNSLNLAGETRDVMFFDSTLSIGLMSESDSSRYDVTKDSAFILQYTSPFFGGEGSMWRILYIDLSMTGGATATISILNAQQDTLTTSQFTGLLTTDKYNYRVGVGNHIGEYLAFGFTTQTNLADSANFQLHDARVHMVKMGEVRVK